MGRGERVRGGSNYGKSKPRVEQRQLAWWGRGHRESIPWKFSLREIHAGPGRRKKNYVVPSSACCERNRFCYELFPTLDRHWTGVEIKDQDHPKTPFCCCCRRLFATNCESFLKRYFLWRWLGSSHPVRWCWAPSLPDALGKRFSYQRRPN